VPGFIVVDSADLTKLVIEIDGEVLILPYGEAVRRRSTPGGDALSDPGDNGRRNPRCVPFREQSTFGQIDGYSGPTRPSERETENESQ
jgi:hypothetical protein